MNYVVTESQISIGLIGTFDVDNFGDCLFPYLYMFEFRKRFPNAIFTLYSPRAKPSILTDFRELRALPSNLDHHSFFEDFLIVTGGETISIGHDSGTYIFPVKSLSAYLRIWLAPTYLTKNTSTRFIIYSAGLAPPMEKYQNLIGQVFRSAYYVKLRDRISDKKLNNKFGIAVDPIFMISNMLDKKDWERRFKSSISFSYCSDYIVFQFSQSYLHPSLQIWCNQVIRAIDELGLDVLFLPICHMLNDLELLKLAKSIIIKDRPDLSNRINIVEDKLFVLDTASIISQCAGYVGTSLHGAVSSVSFGKPLAVYSKDLEGKHAQTLSAAGIFGVVTDKIEILIDVLKESMNSDVETLRLQSIEQANSDFQKLCIYMINGEVSRHSVDEDVLNKIILADKMNAFTFKEKVKRVIFKAMRTIPYIWDIYEKIKFSWRFRNL